MEEESAQRGAEDEDNEKRAVVIDIVINHGKSYRDAGQQDQSNLRRSTVAGILRADNYLLY